MLGLLFLLVIKSLLLILTLAVFGLALRRLMLSNSANAWLYAATALFALLTSLGLVPRTLGFGHSHPVFFVFAAMTPAIWYGVVTMCNSTRPLRYDSELERTFVRFTTMLSTPRLTSPLVLKDPKFPDAPQPVFRHTPSSGLGMPEPVMEPVLEQPSPAPKEARVLRRGRASEATQSLLGIARAMRRNKTSESRRIKLLPPPARAEDRSLGFLRTTESA
jgi:hypothetical protein